MSTQRNSTERRAGGLAGIAAANLQTRGLLLAMLEDLAGRIREERIGAREAAAVLRRLAPFCRPADGGRGPLTPNLADLRALLHSEEIRDSAPGFAEFHARAARSRSGH